VTKRLCDARSPSSSSRPPRTDHPSPKSRPCISPRSTACTSGHLSLPVTFPMIERRLDELAGNAPGCHRRLHEAATRVRAADVLYIRHVSAAGWPAHATHHGSSWLLKDAGSPISNITGLVLNNASTTSTYSLETGPISVVPGQRFGSKIASELGAGGTRIRDQRIMSPYPCVCPQFQQTPQTC
jgi:hypothetical protein